MIKFEYWLPEELNEEQKDALWAEDVCMDDIDYMLFFEELEIVKPVIPHRLRYFKYKIEPVDAQIECLLHGCCENKWYEVKDFCGRSGILGVAYHA